MIQFCLISKNKGHALSLNAYFIKRSGTRGKNAIFKKDGINIASLFASRIYL